MEVTPLPLPLGEVSTLKGVDGEGEHANELRND